MTFREKLGSLSGQGLGWAAVSSRCATLMLESRLHHQNLLSGS